MKKFLDELREQRWDDHRFYHHNLVNRSLHFVSAISFICTYVLVFTQPVMAVLVGWLFSMVTRQSGHFFFEPKGYDEENQATHAFKEDVKVGYNLRRKVVLHAIWGATPFVLLVSRTWFGLWPAWTDFFSYCHHLSKLWFALAIGALLFRTIQLFFVRSVFTGLVWFTKILTDPFHDMMLYYKAPFQLLRGDPMNATASHQAAPGSVQI